MKFEHIEIFAVDMQASLVFYRDALGFDVTVEQGPGLVWLQKGPVEILLRKGEGAVPSPRYEDAAVGFVLYTDDVPGRLRKLEAAGVEIRGTVDTDKCYTFTDPDGNWFQLVDPEDH